MYRSERCDKNKNDEDNRTNKALKSESTMIFKCQTFSFKLFFPYSKSFHASLKFHTFFVMTVIFTPERSIQ